MSWSRQFFRLNPHLVFDIAIETVLAGLQSVAVKREDSELGAGDLTWVFGDFILGQSGVTRALG